MDNISAVVIGLFEFTEKYILKALSRLDKNDSIDYLNLLNNYINELLEDNCTKDL